MKRVISFRMFVVLNLSMAVLKAGATKNEHISADSNGIDFLSNLSLPQILNEAKADNKFVFFEFYATWCGPCKAMDQQVYNQAYVGDVVNADFISVKIQIDSTENDNDNVKKWYGDARKLIEKYSVQQMPTYVFLNSEGRLVFENFGAIPAEEFILMTQTIVKNENDYTSAVHAYQNAPVNISQLRTIIRGSMIRGDSNLNYTATELFWQNIGYSELFTKENISFIHDNTQHAGERGFNFYLQNRDTIDKIMPSDYCEWFLTSLIVKDKIEPIMKGNVEPDWLGLAQGLKKRFGDYLSDRSILLEQINWYSNRNQSSKFSTSLVKYVNRYAINSNTLLLNNWAWAIFNNSNSISELKDALRWMEGVIEQERDNPVWLDTYANILYKLGICNLAIREEMKALDITKSYKVYNAYNKDIETNLRKMEKNIPTWPTINK